MNEYFVTYEGGDMDGKSYIFFKRPPDEIFYGKYRLETRDRWVDGKKAKHYVYVLAKQEDTAALFDSESVESADLRMDFERYMKGLKARDARVLYLWACGHTQEEISAEVGVTQQHVSRLLAEMCKKIL